MLIALQISLIFSSFYSLFPAPNHPQVFTILLRVSMGYVYKYISTLVYLFTFPHSETDFWTEIEMM